jgi:hypothetical protein
MMEAIRSSETSVLTKNTRRKIPEDGFLHSHRRENLKSFSTVRTASYTPALQTILRHSALQIEQLVEALCYKPEGCGFNSR